MSLKEDPRRPGAIHAFHREKIESDQLPPDYFSVISMLCGATGVFLKVRKKIPYLLYSLSSMTSWNILIFER